MISKKLSHLSVNEQIEHVVSLSTDLQTGFDPIEGGDLEELGSLEGTEKVLLGHGLGRPLLELVQDVAFELPTEWTISNFHDSRAR